MSGCTTCGGFGNRHDLGAHFDAGEELNVTYAEAATCAHTEHAARTTGRYGRNPQDPNRWEACP